VLQVPADCLLQARREALAGLPAELAADLAVIGVSLLDHIIVGDNQFFSFREQGLL